jgi:hypothetical protein
MRKGSLMAALVAAAAFLFVANTASAQYPPPKETLVCVVADVQIKEGDTTRLTVTLRDVSGQPLSERTLYFSVVSGSAQLSSSSAITDGSGNAWVTVTPGSGDAMISARSDSAECRATISTSRTISPPATGSGGLTGNNDKSAAVAALVLTVLSLGMSATLLRRGRPV